MISLDVPAFLVHDVGKFPIVVVKPEAVVPGYAQRWAAEMDVLVTHGVPFAIVYRGTVTHETAEDFAGRQQWLQRNRLAITRLCRILVVVEPNDMLRERARLHGRSASKVLGIPHRAVATHGEAGDILSHRMGIRGIMGWG